MLIDSINQFRRDINTQLSTRLNVLYGANAFLAKEIYNRIEKGRKIRTYLFLTAASSLNPAVDCKHNLDVALTIEMIHAASVLVDDILDQDDIRHGYASSHSRLGTRISSLESHILCAEAFALVSKYPTLLQKLITVYQKLAQGEMYDVLLPKPYDAWIYEGYTELISQKTNVLFQFALEAAAIVSSRADLLPELSKIGNHLGTLYQFSNDYFDLQPRNLAKRHGMTDLWPVTFSLPIALYLKKHRSKEVLSFLTGEPLPYSDWQKLLNLVWQPEIKDEALAMIQKKQNDLSELLKSDSIPVEIIEMLEQFSVLVTREEFWYHPVHDQ